MAELSIVIVSYNTREDLTACLAALHTDRPVIEHHIVVVDNASRDGSVETVRARFPAVTVLENTSNLGFAQAVNQGFRATDGELVLLLNSDTMVPHGALDALAARLRAHPDTAVIGPRLTDASGRPEISFGRMITPVRALIQKARAHILAADTPLLGGWVARWLQRPRTTDWVSGACMLIRRAAAEEVGLLDERYFLYNEDVDFCAAIRRRGARVRFTPEVTVIHHRGRSGAGAPDSTRQCYRRSQIAFYAKHHPGWSRALALYLRLRGERPPSDPPA